MIVGVPKEIKPGEARVALVPAGVEALVADGHTVIVEQGAGAGSGFSDDAYASAGAVLDNVDAVWSRADLIVKVKEPIEAEYRRIRPKQTLFCYFHFAASEALTRAVLDSGGVAIAYETVQLPTGELPLLTPMSEIAGRLATQQAAHYLQARYGGRGVLMGGVPGVEPATVVVLGGGVVGANAARIAAGLGARVVVLDVSLARLRHLANVMPANVTVLYSNRHTVLEWLERADVVIGAVLIPGAKAPRLVRRQDLARMKPGAVIVDVAIDQGGCIETIRPTTHADPVYEVDGILHYGVTNIPAAVPRTSTLALTNATFPYIRALARHGWQAACRADRALLAGLSMADGLLLCRGTAEAFGLEHTPPARVLEASRVVPATAALA